MSNDICDILTNKEVIAIDQDPLGKQGYQFMDHPGKQIWVKELSDGCWAVCFFNNSEEAVKLRINWANFSFLAGNYEIRDLWKKKNVGITAKNFEDKVDALDVILVKLTPVKK
jgi:alpha-galactosidase